MIWLPKVDKNVDRTLKYYEWKEHTQKYTHFEEIYKNVVFSHCPTSLFDDTFDSKVRKLEYLKIYSS